LDPIRLDNGEIYQENGFLNQSSIGFIPLQELKPCNCFWSVVIEMLYYIYPDNVSVVILTNLVGSRPENFMKKFIQTENK
jgi:hypothetical protein